MARTGFVGIQRRYVAYCLEHGAASADEMLERDRKAWPGGAMCGFTLWISARWREWRALNKRHANDILSQQDHDAFDAWLVERALPQKSAA